MKKIKESQAITLISLIITIIILLILAGISIIVLKDSGLFKNTTEAKIRTEISTEKEQVQLGYLDAKMNNSDERIKEEQLQEALDKLVGENKTKAIDDFESFVVKFEESGRYYKIDDSGNISDLVDIKKDEIPGSLSGSGTEESPFIIMSIEDLIVFSNITNGTGIKLNEDGSSEEITKANIYSDKYVVLGTTLNFKSKLSYVDYARKDLGDINNNGVVEELLQEMTTGTGFRPINNYNGYFNGNNYEIQNIYINRDEEAGLFIATSNYGMKKIENLGITGNINSIKSNAVGLCRASDIIENCWNKADVTSIGNAAGICHYSSTIKKCYNTGNIITTGEFDSQKYAGVAGGLKSGYGGTIEDSYNKGKVIGTYYTGGIAAGHGNGFTTISNCYNEGDITGKGAVGGILGASAKIENCYNIGFVESIGNSYAGGIVGGYIKEVNYCYNKGSIYGNYAGGIAGSSGGKIINSYNIGKIIGNNVRGIAGMNAANGSVEISNCFNSGEITKWGETFQNCAGILGWNNTNANIQINNCYNIATFSKGHSSNVIRGIVAKNDGTVILNKCYYIKNDEITSAGAGYKDDENQVIGCTEITEITADILNNNINNIEHIDEWKKWKSGQDKYPIFE